MDSPPDDRGLFEDPEWQAAIAGVVAAPVLIVLGVMIGLVEGGLLPGACQGLACVFSALVFGAVAVITVTWLVLWGTVHLARRRWPGSTWRLWALRAVALLSWGPVMWLLVLALES